VLAESGAGVYNIDIFQQVIESRGVVLGVLILLVGLSLATWFIAGYKWLLFARVRRQSRVFLDRFWNSGDIGDVREHARNNLGSPLAVIFVAGYDELQRVTSAVQEGKLSRSDGFTNVERAMQRTAAAELARLERRVSFLATTGSSAPFIGLFGTVWGIMKAFAYIHPDRPILETVTPHIAQALIATAVGLLAAIPAVMAYNYFVSKIRGFGTEMESFSTDLLNILRRLYT